MNRTGEPDVAELKAQLAAHAAEIAALKAERQALSQRIVKLEEELALAGSVRILVSGAGCSSFGDEPFLELDGELGLRFRPFPWLHFPLCADIAQDQKDQLHRCIIVGKMAPDFDGAPQFRVQ